MTTVVEGLEVDAARALRKGCAGASEVPLRPPRSRGSRFFEDRHCLPDNELFVSADCRKALRSRPAVARPGGPVAGSHPSGYRFRREGRSAERAEVPWLTSNGIYTVRAGNSTTAPGGSDRVKPSAREAHAVIVALPMS